MTMTFAEASERYFKFYDSLIHEVRIRRGEFVHLTIEAKSLEGWEKVVFKMSGNTKTFLDQRGWDPLVLSYGVNLFDASSLSERFSGQTIVSFSNDEDVHYPDDDLFFVVCDKVEVERAATPL